MQSDQKLRRPTSGPQSWTLIMPAAIDAVQPDRPVRPGEANSYTRRSFGTGTKLLNKIRQGKAFSPLFLILIGQVGQVGPALKSPMLLASDLALCSRTTRTEAFPRGRPVVQGVTAPPSPTSPPRCDHSTLSPCYRVTMKSSYPPVCHHSPTIKTSPSDR